MTQLVRSLRSGQITIPAIFRDKLGIGIDTWLQITLNGSELRIKPVQVTDQLGDRTWLKKLYVHFNKVRQEAGKYSEAEINKIIDQAVNS